MLYIFFSVKLLDNALASDNRLSSPQKQYQGETNYLTGIVQNPISSPTSLPYTLIYQYQPTTIPENTETIEYDEKKEYITKQQDLFL